METDLSALCKAAQMKISSRIKTSRRDIKHQNNSRQPGKREGEVTKELVLKQRLYQITDQPEDEKNIRKMQKVDLMCPKTVQKTT